MFMLHAVAKECDMQVLDVIKTVVCAALLTSYRELLACNAVKSDDA